MRIIGVLDLLDGRAVHARAGSRSDYAPVRAVAGSVVEPGDALALARLYLERFGVTELYAADLDAIQGDAPQEATIAALAALGGPLWLDAGVTSVDQARHAIDLGASYVVVGLETLRSYQALEEISAAVSSARVAFSLDLKDGRPIVRHQAGGPLSGAPSDAMPPHLIAARAADAGAGAVIVLDLARVGTGAGLDFELIARVREAVPRLTLLAGGGIGGAGDLARLADAGCDGALVATAMHEGRLTAAEPAATINRSGRRDRRAN